MKKILALALSFALVACLAVSVSAADGREEICTTLPVTSSQTIDVTLTGSNIGTGNTGIVYSVTVDWEAANLEFNVTNSTNEALKWNPETHTYDVQTEGTVQGKWVTDKDNFDVTITNHSNAAVKATLVLPSTDGITNATFSAAVTGETRQATANALVATLESAADGDSLYNPALAPTITYTITAGGLPSASFSIATNVELSVVSTQ